jgi:hypothetical protein
VSPILNEKRGAVSLHSGFSVGLMMRACALWKCVSTMFLDIGLRTANAVWQLYTNYFLRKHSLEGEDKVIQNG